MADRYLLGPRAARFIHEQMNASAAGSTRSGGVVLSQSLRYPDPWTVQFASSVRRAGEAEEDSVGHWIAYLPDGSWHGATVESDDDESEDYLEPADSYGDGWYIFPEDLEEEIDAATEAGDPIEIYANLTIRGKIYLSTSENGVRIALLKCDDSAGTKNVDQIVRSTVFSCLPKPFEISTNSSGDLCFKRNYYTVGAKTYKMEDAQAVLSDVDYPCIIALKVSMTGSQPCAELVSVSGLSALQSLQDDEAYAVLPLYEIDSDGLIECDLRSAITIPAFEF